MAASRTRLTREEARARTRKALIDSARRLMVTEGVNVSLDAISADAGLTTGAIYSNFFGRRDLILAVFAEQFEEGSVAMARLEQMDGSLEDVLTFFAEAAESMRSAEEARSRILFGLHAIEMLAQDEDLRHEIAPLMAREMDTLVRVLSGRPSRHLPEGELTTAQDAHAIASVMRALDTGYALRWLAFPGEEQSGVPMRETLVGLGALIPALRSGARSDSDVVAAGGTSADQELKARLRRRS